MSRAAGKWRLHRRAELHWRHFDGEWVAFEAGSGDTHQFDTISAAVLMCLELEPHDLRELSEAIAAELNLALSEGLADRIEQLIDQLTRLDLVEPVEFVIVADLPKSDLARRIGTEGLAFQCGPFVVRVNSAIPAILQGLELLYADYPVVAIDEFADVNMRLSRLGHFGRPQVMVDFDGEHPFSPLPLAHAWPCFEWALNWSIASTANYFLVLHAAVLERGGRAAVFPGQPGSGKSTLCAALTRHGWRLLSDELTLLDPARGDIMPIPRPVSLKNQSIDIIRKYLPQPVLGRTVHYTTKGSVSHLKPPARDVARAAETAKPGWVVFPKYAAGASLRFERHSRADTVLELGNNAFNYHILGREGFDAVGDLVEASGCYDLEYGKLEDAVGALETMAGAPL